MKWNELKIELLSFVTILTFVISLSMWVIAFFINQEIIEFIKSNQSRFFIVAILAFIVSCLLYREHPLNKKGE